MKIIYICGPYITLGQFLKLENLISSGFEAKIFLKNTSVFVNQQLEQRRGRKLYDNDLVVIKSETYLIKFNFLVK